MFVVMTHEHRHIRRSPDNITFAAIERLAADEGACLAFFEAARFPGGLICSACGAQEGQGDYFTRHRARPGLFTCGNCRRQFSITSGTAMHRTRLPLGQWLRAIWLLAASSKGVSARKLSEMLGLPAYNRVARDHKHLKVIHSAGQLVARDPAGLGIDAHVNTAEAIHSMIRRSVIGVWHWISKSTWIATSTRWHGDTTAGMKGIWPGLSISSFMAACPCR